MEAVLKLDKLNNLLTFICKGLNLSFSVNPNISHIYFLDEVDNGYMVIQTNMGYMVIQTNMGEEYIDLLGMLELERYDKRFINKAEQILNGINLENIRLGG